MTTEAKEQARTAKALDEIASWAKALAAGQSPDGGENIAFSLARQGDGLFGDSFLSDGDCTPFVPSGKRGSLHNQPPPFPAPTALFISANNVTNPVPYALIVDLNGGIVTLRGAFPGLAPTLEFRVEYFKHFEGAGGKCILFYSDKSSDNAGYLITFNLVGAS